MAKKVLVPMADGCEEIEAVSIIDVLRRAGVEVTMAAVKDELHVKGANGITFKCDATFDAIKDDAFDMIILPGGYEGVDNLIASDAVQNRLKQMDANKQNIGAICAAPIALEFAGVLKEHFTCYPGSEERIRLEGFESDNYMVVQEGNVITSRGPGTAICFALEIVKNLVDDETYSGLKNGLLADYCGSKKVF